MIDYRVGRTRYARDLDGEGARLHGRRWNHPLTPCIYTSESRALALLEYTANVNIDDIPRLIYSGRPIMELSKSLPLSWTMSSITCSTRYFARP